MLNEFALGDVVTMKKPHACGTNAWTITRTGADIKLRCNACGRIVMLDRLDFIRMGRKVIAHAEAKKEEDC